MISFYPGPSKVYPQIPAYVQEAHDEGVLSINHRSPEFISLAKRTVELVKEKLQVPAMYTVLFASSATECWEIICQSLVKRHSFHIYNGAFGEKWYRYATGLVPETDSHPFDPQGLPELSDLRPRTIELLCVTQNETSNGTALPAAWMKALRNQFSEALIAVDATSSMAGVALPWLTADVWFASVQKCFGLPAGMALMILSPAAVARVQQLGEKKHYNSLLSMYEQSQRYQTTHTPNVLNVYLLMRTMEQRPSIVQVDQELQQRYRYWVEVFHELPYLKLLINNQLVRSKTVIPFQADPAVIQQLRHEARKQEIILGNGYGTLKDTTLRIANFPALTSDEIDRLATFFRQFSPGPA